MYLKKRFFPTSLLTLFIVLTCFPIYAQDEVETENTEGKVRKVQWVPLPVLTAKPQIGVGFGVLGMALFKPGGVNPETTRTSNVQAYFIYTTKGQMMFSPEYNLFLNNDDYILQGKFRYFKYPQDFFGIGNEVTESDHRINIDYDLITVDQSVVKKLSPGVFAGLIYRFSGVYNLKWDPDGEYLPTHPDNLEKTTSELEDLQRQYLGIRYDDRLLDTEEGGGYSASGIGFTFFLDKRDNIVNASLGHFVQVSTIFHQKLLGSSSNFTSFTLDARKYFNVYPDKRHILAIQAYGEFTGGVVPFLEMPQLGGPNVMRGYSEGRYMDNNYMAFQAEYRMPIWWRIGMAAFGGFGDVAEKFQDFSWETLKPSYGMGLRFAINRKENLNIRLDYGFGRKSSGFYLEIQEAF
ncbi:BamA/TamA family outer membrane protein [Xanthovirga aplysinae]|uniref:BamA/TamA family outer membrane protein n=1 Tax=Xanthovirga aplysinae TaxID=2529853 RepID=UPI0012BBD4EF|nr:BamA/TamA family outer membrane protein [Xanthovirga aplysinae]MTI32191.1 hypothetical protein [Xanthovirga aplysinae]